MASIIYQFAYAPDAAGLDIDVKDAATDEVVASGSLSESPDENGVVTFKPSLDEGNYYGEVMVPGATGVDGEAHPSRLRVVAGVLDTPASLAANAGVGASETAYFVATGPTSVSDGSSHAVTLVADDRHGALPAWVTIVGGEALLGEEAGTCAFSTKAQCSMDFSSTTPVASDDAIFATVGVQLDGDDLLNFPESAAKAGDGTDTQVTNVVAGGGLLPVAGTVSVQAGAYNNAHSVSDAVVTPSVALTITRIAQAAVLPD